MGGGGVGRWTQRVVELKVEQNAWERGGEGLEVVSYS